MTPRRLRVIALPFMHFPTERKLRNKEGRNVFLINYFLRLSKTYANGFWDLWVSAHSDYELRDLYKDD